MPFAPSEDRLKPHEDKLVEVEHLHSQFFTFPFPLLSRKDALFTCPTMKNGKGRMENIAASQLNLTSLG
jgi:hypothetical protein